MEVWDHDEVIEGGNYMTEQGWKEARRLGRHTIGSNVFRFFEAPCGGRIELAADMDRVDKSFKTRGVGQGSASPPLDVEVPRRCTGPPLTAAVSPDYLRMRLNCSNSSS